MATRELDRNGRPYKCGFNWLPDWIFDEPVFTPCCKQHDIAYANGLKGKFSADVAMLVCTLKRAQLTRAGWMRARDYAQAFLMFFILVQPVIPIAYIAYYVSKWKRKHGKA